MTMGCVRPLPWRRARRTTVVTVCGSTIVDMWSWPGKRKMMKNGHYWIITTLIYLTFKINYFSDDNFIVCVSLPGGHYCKRISYNIIPTNSSLPPGRVAAASVICMEWHYGYNRRDGMGVFKGDLGCSLSRICPEFTIYWAGTVGTKTRMGLCWNVWK